MAMPRPRKRAKAKPKVVTRKFSPEVKEELIKFRQTRGALGGELSGGLLHKASKQKTSVDDATFKKEKAAVAARKAGKKSPSR